MPRRKSGVVVPMRPIGELVDELGAIRLRIAELELVEKKLRAEITATGIEEADGRVFKMLRVEAVRWSVDVKKIREEMGSTWTDARSRQTAMVSLRITPKTETINQLAAAA